MDPVKATSNFFRICRLLIDKGGEALRDTLNAKCPPSTLATVLNANKHVLKKLPCGVINASQWNLLFPAFGTPDSNDFDITLLAILLRNICGLAAPASGWKVMPPVSDTSTSASILRIKLFRNEVYGHVATAQFDDTTFEALWQEISKPLVHLGIPQQDIDDMKEDSLSPEEESYVEKLKEWKELEDDLLSKLNDVEIQVVNVKHEVVDVKHGVVHVKNEVLDVGNKVVNVEKQVSELRNIVEHQSPSPVDKLAKFDFTGKIEGLCQKFQDGTREWFFDKLTSWFTDKESRVMILTAGPGVGKSVLSAEVCELYKKCNQLAGCHFCDFRAPDSGNPHRILQSLASQVCTYVHGFRDKLTKSLQREHSRDSLSDAFRVLVNDPLHSLGEREPTLIVIDALDESKTDSKSEFLDLISDVFPELPKWIKIFITSRPELQVRKKLQHFNPVEILPNNHDHNLDLKHFIQHFLPNLSVRNVNTLISRCEGSFLFAYLLVKELKNGYLGIEPNVSDYIPKGISGFYENQFKRLKKGLQQFKQDTWSPIFKSFVNVIAVSREPLPINIIFACMGLSDQEYEIRETVIGIMSEILPVYDDCLTVYHKSLWDWLTLDGYEEHAFVADVGDGRKRLWRACRSIFSDIESLRSVSDFQTSSVKMYALKNGAKYLESVDEAEDFCWLVNIRINYLKLKFGYNLKLDFLRILEIYKSKVTDFVDHIYLGILQLHSFSKRILDVQIERTSLFHELHSSNKYVDVFLQSISNEFFEVQNSIGCKNGARDILDKADEIWIEITQESRTNSTYKILSHAILGSDQGLFGFSATALSPNKELIACSHKRRVEIFKLPSLKMDFKVAVGYICKFLKFSPDSSYLLFNSIRSCISLSEQKEVPFIVQGPDEILYCSFSSCGMKLVTSERGFIKMWDVGKKVLIVKVETKVDVEYCFFSNCSSYVLARPWHALDFDGLINFDDFVVLESKSLIKLDIGDICAESCLTLEMCCQIISPRPFGPNLLNSKIRTRHFHLPTGEIILFANKHSSDPFAWKDRKCVALSNARRNASELIVYDYINQTIVDIFPVDILLNGTSIRYCISKLDEASFLVSINSCHLFLLSFVTSTRCSALKYVDLPTLKCCALSPENLFLACFYENGILTIQSVDSREILQTVVLKQPAEACWWSQSYLWVVVKGFVVKYPFDSAHTNILGYQIEECVLDFESVLKFVNGVLAIQVNDNREIAFFKIFSDKLCAQEIPDSHFAASSVAISSDGCAVLIYRESSSDYQLWETPCENRWELVSTGMLHDYDVVTWFCLTGTKDSRSSLWLTYMSSSDFEDTLNEPLAIFSIDFPNCTLVGYREFPLSIFVNHKDVIHADSNLLVIHYGAHVYFIDVSKGEIIAKIFFGYIGPAIKVSYFYVPSQGLHLLVRNNGIKYFKIHNVENLLTSLTNE